MATTHETRQSLAALRAIDPFPVPPLEKGSTVRIVNYFDQTASTPVGPAGGGGLYRWDPASDEQPDNGAVVAPNVSWNSSPGNWDVGRWLLVHEGFVNIRQFGALGILEGNPGVPPTVADLNSKRSFANDAEMKATYSGGHGEPFNGLKDADTADWAAIQAALVWCGENGVRLEGNSGDFFIRRPLWMGDDDVSFAQGRETEDKDSAEQGLTFVGQTGNSREQADGGV
ncbi:MAG: hypothetical protein IT207_00845 [Fimbriimonadaceae bacterium]|nr:hypothetical protein [Fimbriimonadaceae bacterium]